MILQSQFHPNLLHCRKLQTNVGTIAVVLRCNHTNPKTLTSRRWQTFLKPWLLQKRKRKKREEEKEYSYFEAVANNQLNRVSILLLYPLLNPSPFFSIIREGQFRKRTRQPTPKIDSVKRENRHNSRKNVEQVHCTCLWRETLRLAVSLGFKTMTYLASTSARFRKAIILSSLISSALLLTTTTTANLMLLPRITALKENNRR